MKRSLATAFALVGAFTMIHAEDALKDTKDKNSYAIGVDIGSGLKRSNLEIKPDLVAKGITDALTGAKTLLTEEQVQQTLEALNTEMQAKQQASAAKAGEQNKATGDAYLAENKKKDGVKTTASGLQYKVLTEGKGDHPKATDTVTVNYKGTLISGTEFDSSYKRNEPATFPLNRVIPGWTEGVQLMTVGAKYAFTIPAALAYGEQGPPGIGPNQVLNFEVELLKIEKAAEATTEPVSAADAKK